MLRRVRMPLFAIHRDDLIAFRLCSVLVLAADGSSGTICWGERIIHQIQRSPPPRSLSESTATTLKLSTCGGRLADNYRGGLIGRRQLWIGSTTKLQIIPTSCTPRKPLLLFFLTTTMGQRKFQVTNQQTIALQICCNYCNLGFYYYVIEGLYSPALALVLNDIMDQIRGCSNRVIAGRTNYVLELVYPAF